MPALSIARGLPTYTPYPPMQLDFLEPRHAHLLPRYLLVENITEYRRALYVLARSPSVDSRHLQEHLRTAIAQLEAELGRRQSIP